MTALFPRFPARTFQILVLLILITMCLPNVTAISVSGAKYMDSIKPGGTTTHTMTVSIGAGDDPADIQVDVLGFGQGLEMSYSPLTTADDVSPYSARSFITVDESTVHLEPGAKKTITAKISVPANAGPGGRYAIIYIHALPGKGKSFTTAITVPVMITISGSAPTETGSITNLSVSDIVVGQPLKVTTILENTGNYHYYHTANLVVIRDANGNIVSNKSTQPTVFAVIPGNTVRYSVTPELQNLPIGSYTVTSQVLLETGKVLDERSATFEVKTNYVPPITESNITLTPGSSGTLTSPDGRYSVSFPQGAVLGDAVVILKPYSKDRLSSAPSGANLGATSFEITGLSGLLSKDATVKVIYSKDDLEAAGGDASQLKLAYYDAAQNKWVVLPTQVDTGSTTLTTTTNHLSVWAVMVSSTTTGGSTASGDVPGATATQSPVPMTVILTALTIAVIACGESVRKRR
ncbi:MAG: hypothetical protein M0R30_03880 [Methanoregula sp.]|jgi:hypothetical protein|uniref:hypothetical protein n=1 Tax=Methanoregula sp. TaxID=2052170 RepID=UPI0025FF6019|nr:hypothetical protein [Methanoregula sp.]MCK9630760.1 hypothetical protein [Methanoregula sp.]